MKNLNKLFKWLMWLLFAVSVGILVFGVVKGYPTSAAEGDNGTVNALIYWCYAMIGTAAFCAVVFGIAVSVANNPKSVIKLGIGIVVEQHSAVWLMHLHLPAQPSVCSRSRPTENLSSQIQYSTSLHSLVAFQ